MAAAEGGLTPTSRHTGEERELAAGPSTVSRQAAEAEIAGFGARRCGRESKGPAVPHRTIVPLAGGRASGPAATDGQNRAAVEEPEVGEWA